MSDWDKLSPSQKAAVTESRKRAGHSSVHEAEKRMVLDARAKAFGEACDWLKAAGYLEASAALEAAAFEPGDRNGAR